MRGGAKPLSSDCCYEHNWKPEINKWKTASYNFTTKCFFLPNLKFAQLRYQIQASC